MSMRPVPKTWEEFQAYWDHMCSDVLENNYAARAVLDLTELPKPPFAQWIPDSAVGSAAQALAPFFVWLTVGLYDPAGARADGLHVVGARRVAAPALRRRGARWCSRCCRTARAMHPRARAGWDRATGPLPADSPLPQTPARNLPPLDERHKPTHYCPVAGV